LAELRRVALRQAELLRDGDIFLGDSSEASGMSESLDNFFKGRVRSDGQFFPLKPGLEDGRKDKFR
jgi:hypothetical protein